MHASSGAVLQQRLNAGMGGLFSMFDDGAKDMWRHDVFKPDADMWPQGHSIVWPAGTNYVKVFPYAAPVVATSPRTKVAGRDYHGVPSTPSRLYWPLVADYHYIASHDHCAYQQIAANPLPCFETTRGTMSVVHKMQYTRTADILAPLSQCHGSDNIHWDTLEKDTEMTAHLPHRTAYSRLFGGSIYVRVTQNPDMTPCYHQQFTLFDYVEDYWIVPQDPALFTECSPN